MADRRVAGARPRSAVSAGKTSHPPSRAGRPAGPATTAVRRSASACDSSLRLSTDLQHRKKRLLRYFHVSELLHALLAFFLFLEEFAFAADIPAVALCQHVLAQRLDRGARNDGPADRRLDRDFEHLSRDQLMHLVDQLARAMIGVLAMHDDRERIDLVAVDENIELHERRRLEMTELVI